MQLSERGLALIKTSEGFSATQYICPAGKNTIGYGHVVGAGETYPEVIDEQQATEILLKDVSISERAVAALVKVPLSQCQFDALAVLIYNIGVGAFAKSTLLKNLNNGDIAAAIAQWKRWVYAGGAVLSGLVTRRNAEIALFVTEPSPLFVTPA